MPADNGNAGWQLSRYDRYHHQYHHRLRMNPQGHYRYYPHRQLHIAILMRAAAEPRLAAYVGQVSWSQSRGCVWRGGKQSHSRIHRPQCGWCCCCYGNCVIFVIIKERKRRKKNFLDDIGGGSGKKETPKKKTRSGKKISSIFLLPSKTTDLLLSDSLPTSTWIVR